MNGRVDDVEKRFRAMQHKMLNYALQKKFFLEKFFFRNEVNPFRVVGEQHPSQENEDEIECFEKQFREFFVAFKFGYNTSLEIALKLEVI